MFQVGQQYTKMELILKFSDFKSSFVFDTHNIETLTKSLDQQLLFSLYSEWF